MTDLASIAQACAHDFKHDKAGSFWCPKCGTAKKADGTLLLPSQIGEACRDGGHRFMKINELKQADRTTALSRHCSCCGVYRVDRYEGDLFMGNFIPLQYPESLKQK